MDLNSLKETIKKHPDFAKAGMILCHNGVVRQSSRDGRQVSGLRIQVDHDRLKKIIAENKKRPGIIEIRVEIAEEQDLKVGDDVMLLAVAGDIRENVIAVLSETLDAIKTTVTHKIEFFISESMVAE
jgi:molybdopterin synthase catalytic subunit